MDFIKNWLGGTNNTSDDIGANNAKDENKVKRSQIRSFYCELLNLASNSKIDRKDLREFHGQLIKNRTLLNKAIKEKREEKIKEAEEATDKTVGAFIKYISGRKLEKIFIEIFEKYNGKLSEALNSKISKILKKNGLSNGSNSTAESIENVSKKLIASDKKPAPAAFKRKKAEDSFSKPKVDNKKPAQAVHKRNAAGSLKKLKENNGNTAPAASKKKIIKGSSSRKSKLNIHNSKNVDTGKVAENKNLNILAEEDKIKEVDAKAKEICKESASLFKKCVSAGGNLLWWGAKGAFKGVEYPLYYLYKAACYGYKYASVGLEKLEAAEKFLNRPIVKKAVYYALDSLIEKNIKSDIAIAGEKAATDTIKDLIRKGHKNIDLIAGAVGGSIGGPIGVGVGYVLSRFASNFLSRSEKAVDSMDKRWHNAILKKYCADQKTFIGEKALSLFCILNSIGYFDDLKIDENKSNKSDVEKK